MQKWEYNTVFLTWDGEKKTWKSDETTQGRMYELLDRVGEQGWELVNFAPSVTQGTGVTQYIAVFKRPKA